MKGKWFVGLAFVIACAAIGAMVGLLLTGEDPKKVVQDLKVNNLYDRIPKLQLPAVLPSKVIYLNREGAEITHGVDEASKNRTSLVPKDKAAALIPAFTGSSSTWNRLVACIRDKFERYDVAVVDRRPIEAGYMMAVVGGKADDLGRKETHHATGLAPFNGEPIPNAVVLIFSAALKNNVTAMCETAGMEIAHAYGLDHARHCSDLMTYMKRCGARTFLDEDLKCGEHGDRDCPRGEKTQNSHRHLVKLLGARSKKVAARN
ncbi:MAG: hypothetical protein RIT81_17425 [Deltaproteobacteria bacterium]